MGDVLYQFLPINVGFPFSLCDVVVHLVDVVVDAAVENNLVVSTSVVDLLDVIVVGCPSSFERCWEVVSLQRSEVHILMLDPVMSDNFWEGALGLLLLMSWSRRSTTYEGKCMICHR